MILIFSKMRIKVCFPRRYAPDKRIIAGVCLSCSFCFTSQRCLQENLIILAFMRNDKRHCRLKLASDYVFLETCIF